jgi:hypothetical protein
LFSSIYQLLAISSNAELSAARLKTTGGAMDLPCLVFGKLVGGFAEVLYAVMHNTGDLQRIRVCSGSHIHP